jgi:hypothetical protein
VKYDWVCPSENVVVSLCDNQEPSVESFVESSDASTTPVSLPDLLSVDEEASVNETSQISEVSEDQFFRKPMTVYEK